MTERPELSPNNLLKPSDGGPVAVPSQDMVLGIYYRRIFIANGLHIVKHFCRGCRAMGIDYLLKNLFQLFLSHMEIHFQKKFIPF